LVPPRCAYEWLEESVSHVAACLAHRVGVTILVDSMIPYTRGILRDYGLTSLVTGIKALVCTRPAIWQRANAECKTGVTAERGKVCPPRKEALLSNQIDNRED
jgi:hypothetical protein